MVIEVSALWGSKQWTVCNNWIDGAIEVSALLDKRGRGCPIIDLGQTVTHTRQTHR